MESTSKYFRVIMYTDRVNPSLCQLIFSSYTSAQYCADRFISLYRLNDATYDIIPLKIVSYEKNT